MTNAVSTLSRPERAREQSFQRLHDHIAQFCRGQSQALTKDDLWGVTIVLWPKGTDIGPPSLSWYEKNHSAFNEWCRHNNHLVSDCNYGLFIPVNDSEIREWQQRQRARVDGVINSNNDTQDLIGEKHPDAAVQERLRLETPDGGDFN